MRYLGFFGVPSVGPVGDFLHILDLFRVILTFILYTMVHYRETTIWENMFCFFQASKKQIQVFLVLKSLTLPETNSIFYKKGIHQSYNKLGVSRTHPA